MPEPLIWFLDFLQRQLIGLCNFVKSLWGKEGFVFCTLADGHYSKLIDFKTEIFLRCDIVIHKK